MANDKDKGGDIIFQSVYSKFTAEKNSWKHDMGKWVLNHVKDLAGEASAAGAAVQFSKKVVSAILSVAFKPAEVALPGLGTLIAMFTDKVLDVAVDKINKKLQGSGVKLGEGIEEYSFKDVRIEDSLKSIVHHAKMMESALQYYKAQREKFSDEFQKPPAGASISLKKLSMRLYKLVHAFLALQWTWQKTHVDAAAILQAQTASSKFVEESQTFMDTEFALLRTLVYGLAFEYPELLQDPLFKIK